MPENNREAPRPKGRTVSFNFSFGKPPDDPRFVEMLKRGESPTALPAGSEIETNTERFKLEIEGGKLRFGGNDLEHEVSLTPKDPEPVDLQKAEMWERLERIADGSGAYPDTARWQARLNIVVWVFAIALPLGALVLTEANSESLETVAFVTFFATLIAAMLRSSIR